ncbi:MAG: TIGR02466 family protein [Lentilitoribacter sp.]
MDKSTRTPTGARIPKRHFLFQTQIYEFQLPKRDIPPLNAALIHFIREKHHQDQKGIQRSNFKALGGWHSNNDLHKDSDISGFCDLIHRNATQIGDDNGYHSGWPLTITAMWSIVNPPGSTNRSHIHPGCLWSGVYYVHAPKDTGDIEFTDPRTANLMLKPKYADRSERPIHTLSNHRFSPRAGRMLIFPSWLYHSVAPNLSKELGAAGERIVISFNLSQRKAI